MLLQAALLVAGLALLCGGGEAVVRAAAALARRLGISPLAIGLTVVSFGTSTPELAVNVKAAWGGETDLSFGNIVGSNIANVGLILGCVALIRPLPLQGAVISREIPLMLIATIAVFLMGLDLGAATTARFGRFDGIVLLLGFGAFLHYSIAEPLRRRAGDPLVQQARGLSRDAWLRPVALRALVLLAGVMALAFGAGLTARAALALAEGLGLPDVVMGLTMVAVGTSLPELSTSMVAAYRRQADLAVGNVVGSNLFNLLFILPVTCMIHPVRIPGGGYTDLGILAVFSVALLPFSMGRRQRIVRAEAGLLLCFYLFYVVWRALPG